MVRRLPERGRIGIFIRLDYEEVLIVRVHPEILARQRLPSTILGKDVFEGRYEDINAHERHLSRNRAPLRSFSGTSRRRSRRSVSRLVWSYPLKQWKFSLGDSCMNRNAGPTSNMAVYERAIERTSTPHAPWIVIPANHKWFARLVVVAAIIDGLESLNILPVPFADRRQAAGARKGWKILRLTGGKGGTDACPMTSRPKVDGSS